MEFGFITWGVAISHRQFGTLLWIFLGSNLDLSTLRHILGPVLAIFEMLRVLFKRKPSENPKFEDGATSPQYLPPATKGYGKVMFSLCRFTARRGGD